MTSTDSEPGGDTAISEARFGNYVLLRHLGSGGMAEVDLARVDGPGGVQKLVVIKRIRPEHATNDVYLRMFLDEARIASVLQHPNIIQVHDVGQIGDLPFIAMEYLRGKNLADILVAATAANRHLPLDFALGVICCVCDGLHYAHQMRTWEGEALSIVHRDVSPDNIFVTYEGHIKLVDFGLAKAKGRSSETRVGVVKGTLGYMAPESFESTDTDRRLDVFTAGVVLWELITGHRLFDASTTREAWEQVRERPVPSPSVFRPECSVPLEAVVRRALNKDASQRFQSARALQTNLENVAEQLGLWLSPVRRSLVMDALFPGRRTKALSDSTVVDRRPTPLALPKREAPSATQRLLRPVSRRIQRHPLAAFWIMVGLLVLSVLLGVVAVSIGGAGFAAAEPPAPGASVTEPATPAVEPGEPGDEKGAKPGRVKRKRKKTR